MRLLPFCLLLFLAIQCKKSDTTGNSSGCTVTYHFQSTIQPLFVQHCGKAGCHDGSLTGPAPLLTYNDIMAGLSQVRDDVQSGRMPQDQPLAASDKQAILCWINSGAPNN